MRLQHSTTRALRRRLRLVALGDWGRVVRDPIDLLRFSYPLGAMVFLALGSSDAIRLAAAAALVLFARRFDLPRPVDLMLCLGVGLEAWGQTFELYDGIGWYDIVVHFTLPFLISPLAYIVLSRSRIVPDLREEARRHHYAGIFLITFCVMLAFGGALWEVYEYVSDTVLGTDLTKGYADAVGDMAATTGGSAAGGLWLIAWAHRQWGTIRTVQVEPADTAPSPVQSAPEWAGRV